MACRMSIICISLTDVRLDFAAAALGVEHQDGSLQRLVVDIVCDLKLIRASGRRCTDEVCARFIEIREITGYDITAGSCT